MIAALAALAVLIVIVIPIHEFLHLLVMSKGRLDDRCIITYGQGAVFTAYNGPITRGCQIASLICPVTVFSAVLAVAILLTAGALRLFFVYLLVMSCLSSYTDIYMVFYLLKHLGKNDIIFGSYKKSQ